MTDALRWVSTPNLRSPIVLVAFSGWNDAGESATAALRVLEKQWSALVFADIDPEEYYDFTASRPQVRLDEMSHRVIDWPSTTFAAATVPGTEIDIVLVIGQEPGLRWRSFCGHLETVAKDVEASMVITLGALLAEVPHTRPVRVMGTAEDQHLLDTYDVRRSNYQGPTGIIGVLQHHLRQAGVPAMSLWAAVPTYVSGPPSPVATQALLARLAELLQVNIDTTDLSEESTQYIERINEVVADDDELRRFLDRLETAYDAEIDTDIHPSAASPDQLIAELEKFLRDQ